MENLTSISISDLNERIHFFLSNDYTNKDKLISLVKTLNKKFVLNLKKNYLLSNKIFQVFEYNASRKYKVNLVVLGEILVTFIHDSSLDLNYVNLMMKRISEALYIITKNKRIKVQMLIKKKEEVCLLLQEFLCFLDPKARFNSKLIQSLMTNMDIHSICCYKMGKMDNHFKSFAMTLAVKKFYQSRLSLQLKEKNNLTRIEVNQNLADKILMRKKQFWEGNIKNIMVAEGDPKVFNSPCTYEVESKRTKFKDLCSQVMEEHSDDDESKEEEMSNTDTTPEMKDEDRSREIIKLDLIRGRDVIENENKEDFARIISSGLIEEISFNVFVNPTK